MRCCASSAARRQLAAEQLSQEVQQRELIRAAFRRYISPKLADKILADPQLRDFTFAQTQVRTRAAVMFADMRGFTAISEQLNPVEVVALLNEFFALLTEITFEYDGTVFNMAGDGLMVGFGVPIEQADGSARAIAAARRMLDRFAVLAEQWRERYDVETGLGIGINVGEVIAGNVGSAAYMNYTIIGDTVNVASRLGQRARAGEMLFSDAVKHSLDEHGVEHRGTAAAGAGAARPLHADRHLLRPVHDPPRPSARLKRGLRLTLACAAARRSLHSGHVSHAHAAVRFSIYRPRPVPGVGRRGRALSSSIQSTSRSPRPPEPVRGFAFVRSPAGSVLNRTVKQV